MIEQLQGLTDNKLNEVLPPLYQGCCHVQPLAAQPGDELERLLESMFKSIYKAMGMPTKITSGLVQWYADAYFNSTQQGYGMHLGSIDYNTPDYEMLRRLKNDVFHFSAAKNYQQLKDTSRALINEDGKLRTWTEFRNKAFEINQQQVTTWLKAEQELAIASGQMAATWTRAIEKADTLPLLKFDAILDGHTTPICTSLNNVIKPIDDNFWDIYYPPNHFGCRSDVQALPGGTITPATDIVYPDKMPAMFKTNLAKNGQVFPADHPYYNGLPHQVSEQAQKLADE